MDEQIDKYSRITGTDRETLRGKVAKMYRDGDMSVRQIAIETGRSYGATHRLLSEAGVSFRPRGSRALKV